MNPSIKLYLDRVGRRPAHTISGAMAKTHQAVIRAMENTRGEVAAAALLAGANTLIGSFRTAVQPLGTSLSMQTESIATAWNTFGATGHWAPPARVTPPVAGVPDPLFSVAGPRPLIDGERITAEFTISAIDSIGSAATDLSTRARDMFVAIAGADAFPDGELVDAIDTAAVDHTQIFASLNATVAQQLRRHIAAVQASYQQYRAGGQWAGPHVTIV